MHNRFTEIRINFSLLIINPNYRLDTTHACPQSLALGVLSFNLFSFSSLSGSASP